MDEPRGLEMGLCMLVSVQVVVIETHSVEAMIDEMGGVSRQVEVRVVQWGRPNSWVEFAESE